MLLEGYAEDEVVGGHVWTDANDSSDSVIHGEDLFLFDNGCSAAVALVAAFIFGLDGGSQPQLMLMGAPLAAGIHINFLRVAVAVLVLLFFWV